MTNNTLYIGGYVHGITIKELNTILPLILKHIDDYDIKNIVFHGDPNKIVRENDPDSYSYTKIFEMLLNERPYLKFIAFRKVGRGKDLIEGLGETYFDDWKNELGPHKFFTKNNTYVLSQGDNFATELQKNENIIVEIPDVKNWYDLGLKAYERLLKEGYKKIYSVYLGQGGIVKKELDIISKNPEMYPELEIIESYHINRD